MIKFINVIAFIVVFVGTAAFIPGCIELEQEILSPLKKAADAPSLTSAHVQLSKALEGIEERGWTKGSIHILYRTESTSLGVWYGQLSEANNEMNNLISSGNTDLQTTNLTLLKLRELILDNSESGEKVTTPSGTFNMVFYPHHILVNIFYWLSALWLLAVFGFWAAGL